MFARMLCSSTSDAILSSSMSSPTAPTEARYCTTSASWLESMPLPRPAGREGGPQATEFPRISPQCVQSSGKSTVCTLRKCTAARSQRTLPRLAHRPSALCA